jgi:hypothetical protein
MLCYTFVHAYTFRLYVYTVNRHADHWRRVLDWCQQRQATRPATHVVTYDLSSTDETRLQHSSTSRLTRRSHPYTTWPSSACATSHEAFSASLSAILTWQWQPTLPAIDLIFFELHSRVENLWGRGHITKQSITDKLQYISWCYSETVDGSRERK